MKEMHPIIKRALVCREAGIPLVVTREELIDLRLEALFSPQAKKIVEALKALGRPNQEQRQ